MQASMAAAAGKPMLSDEEYDDLKAQLRNKNSRVVQQASLTLCTHKHTHSMHSHNSSTSREMDFVSAVFIPKGLFLRCVCAENPEGIKPRVTVLASA